MRLGGNDADASQGQQVTGWSEGFHMKLKLDDKGYAVISDGKPVYVHDDGKEVAFDAVGTVSTIARLNQEAKSHRENAEGLAGRLSAFAEIDDPVAAKKALDAVRNDDKKPVDAQAEQARLDAAIKATEERYKPYVSKNEKLERKLYEKTVGVGFAGSQYIADKLIITHSQARKIFGDHFKVEDDDRLVAYDATGNKLFSRSKPGELADFEEALEMIVDADPGKDHILKGNAATGSGASSRPGVPMTEDLSSLSPTERINAARRRAKR